MNSEDILAKRMNREVMKGRAKYYGPIEYKGELIAQYHNPKLFINDILGENETKQFTSILIIGSPGTGKTTLATFIGHEAHQKNNYYIVRLGKKELLNFDRVMQSLPDQDIILIFDDVSLVFKLIKDATKRTEILQTLTEARHPHLQQKDRKVMVIACIHYVNSIEKMWRSQGSWKIYTDLSLEEIQNFNYMTKSRFKHQIDLFSQISLDQFRKKKFTVSISNKQKRTYTTNKPFRFIMVYDNSNLRFFLVPNESCNFCNGEGHKQAKIKASPKDIIKLAEKYYKKDGPRGIDLALFLAGQTAQFRNNVAYSTNTAREILATFDVDPEALALERRNSKRIKDKRIYTIRKKKTDFIADLEEIQKNEGNVTFGSKAIQDEEDDNDVLDDGEELDEETKEEITEEMKNYDIGEETL